MLDQLSFRFSEINDAYDFADLTKSIEDIGRSRKEIIKKMLQQTYDCAWFIRDYTSRGLCEFFFTLGTLTGY